MPFENSIPDRIIWVSPDGDDSNSGSRDAPLQSIQLAIDRAVPGTAIMLMPGNYSGSFEFEKIEGTEDKPIWLAAADGPGTVTITAPSSSDTIITIQGEDNIIIRDLTLVGGYDGISVNQSGQDFTNLVNNIVIEGNTIIGAAHDGIKVGQTSNVLIYNNTVNGAGEQGIDCLGVTNAVIDGNEIMNVTGSSGLFVKGGSSDVLIANNYIHDVTGDGLLVGGWTQPEFFLPGTDYEAKNVVVTGNVVEDAAKRPLTVRGAQDVDIHDNFFGTMETNESVLLISTGSTELSPPPPSMRVSIHDNVFDRSKNFANIDPSSVDISIVDNVKDGVIEGDMRPFPPEPSPALSETLPDSLLDAPVWATSARSTTNITAGSGNQTLTGTSGNDKLSGGSGDDITIGGAGDDTYSIGSSRDQIIEQVGEGVDTALAYLKNYALPANVENLKVASTVDGGVYEGNELDNILIGGVGSQTLTGGLGDDLFVPSAGNDVIADFAAGPGNGDRIDLRAFTTFVGLDDVLAHATEVGADTVIDLGSGSNLTLVNVAPAALAADDFLFTTVAPPPIVNEPPTDILLSNDVVAEGVGVGAVVGGLSAADPDDGETFTYTLVDDAGGSFAIEGDSLVVAGPLDYETASSRAVTVRVTDSAGNAFERSLTISLTNEAPSLPVDADEVANQVSENTVTGAAVGIVASSGDVSGGAVTYALVDDAGGRFAVDAATGQVTVADASLIDYETAAEHTIIVQASDAAGATSTSSFTIAIGNAPPTAPEDADDTSNEVVEGAATGTAVGIAASATDPRGGAIAYALIDDAGGRFAVDAATGVVTVADGSRLNYETATEHTIVVQASDASGATGTSNFTIGVVNAAPAVPEDLDGGPNQVAEGAANGTAVGVMASAADVNGGNVSYSLLDDAGGRFAIDAATGLVTVADGSLIDFETASEHAIVVEARDASGAANTSTFTIGVTNQAPTAPEDADDAPNLVAEGAEDGAAVGVAIVSADPNSDSVSYSLLHDAGGRFAIDAATGIVTVADGSLLDYETAAEHTIVVQASDASGAASTASFVIGVANQAPTVPEDLDEGQNRVAEGAADGTAVGVAVSSADISGGMVTYSLLDDAGGRFAIDAETGLVTVANGSLIDYETATEHMIVVEARDAGGATATASFTIDVANKAPAVPGDLDAASDQVVENAANGTAVGIAAFAADVNGGAVAYSLLNDAGGRFAIDAATGLVTVANGALLDYETATEHMIVVQASDAAGATSTAAFTIAVGDASGVTITGTNNADIVDATSTVSLKPLPTDEADVISTHGGDDYISALGGDDVINGGTGADTMLGGLGNDTYVVNSNTDSLTEFEGEGVDLVMSSVSFTLGAHFENLTVTGSNGSSATGNELDNVIRGNDSSNVLAGLGGADTLIGGLGMDRASYAASAAGVNVSLATGLGLGGDAEGDTFSDIEGLIGSSFDDIVEGDGGKNVLVGGDGIDTLSYRNAAADITVNLDVTSGQLTGAGSDTISGFESVIGSNFADRLTGTTGANTLSGLDGNDTLVGGAGEDLLVGGAGDDSLTGGAGLDAFAFDFASEGLDTVADFLSGSDYLQISATGFGGGLGAGDLATLVTVADLAAATGGEGGYFIFDNSDDNVGTVYWDETGGTSEDAQAFARLATGTSLLPSDFHVV